jgi:copper chaperone
MPHRLPIQDSMALIAVKAPPCSSGQRPNRETLETAQSRTRSHAYTTLYRWPACLVSSLAPQREPVVARRRIGCETLESPMEQSFEVENLKCSGCARTIESALRADPRVTQVSVDLSRSVVAIEAAADLRPEVAATLARLGYPQKGAVEGLRSAAAVAKSFVSCAVGRLSGRN